MTDQTAPREVIARLEKGEGGREVDALIHQLLNPEHLVLFSAGSMKHRLEPGYNALKHFPMKGWEDWEGVAAHVGAPHYTTSLDAAMTLVPEGWTVGGIYQGDDKRWTAELRKGFATSYSEVVIAPSKAPAEHPALALTLAALKARLA